MTKVKFTKKELEYIECCISCGVSRKQAEITILAERKQKEQKKLEKEQKSLEKSNLKEKKKQDKKAQPKEVKKVSKCSTNFLTKYNISLTPNNILNGAYTVESNNHPIQVATSVGAELTLKWIRSSNTKAAHHRRLIIKKVNDKLEENISGQNKSFDNNLQKVHTPDYICDDMVDLIDFSITTDIFYVFFSLEYVESLVYRKGVNPKQVKYFSDSIAKSRVGTILGVESFVLNVDEFLKGNNMPKSNNIVVIGNPPYQINNQKEGNTTHASSLYDKFVETIIDTISPSKFSFIIPSRWMLGGRGMEKHRIRMSNDKHMKIIRHFPNAGNVFSSGANITGGVNYFLWDKTYNGLCEFDDGVSKKNRDLGEFDVVIQDNKAISILKKVMISTLEWMNKEYCKQDPFEVLTSFKDWSDVGVPCIGKNRQSFFIKKELFVDTHNIIDKWKVVTTKADGGAFDDKYGVVRGLNKMFIIVPGTICNMTYVVMGAFDDEQSANNFLKYSQTKFFNFMLGIMVTTMDINSNKFKFVPDQIDYSKTYSDEELFEKYGLDEEEIAHINSKIKG